VLAAEAELGITAGLQDRVIQVYGGLVYMDFERGLVERHGHGRCVREGPELFSLTPCSMQRGQHAELGQSTLREA
jgi:hypothetical protein